MRDVRAQNTNDNEGVSSDENLSNHILIKYFHHSVVTNNPFEPDIIISRLVNACRRTFASLPSSTAIIWLINVFMYTLQCIGHDVNETKQPQRPSKVKISPPVRRREKCCVLRYLIGLLSRLLEGQFILVLLLTIDSLTTDPKYGIILITSVAKQRIWADLLCYSKGGLTNSVSDCSLAYTDQQFAFCEPFQKNLWESVKCTCWIMLSVESYNVILWPITLMASRFVNNYHGKTGILSITFATREQYSQKLRYDFRCAETVNVNQCRGYSTEWTDSTAWSVVSQRLHHLFAQYEYTIWCK
jgi:hypothetical protein